ncbi:hydroxysqualene dehydroxylase HpnE [Ideonella sp.]|uniref:hydroxysqualene dehydroxylase HpnE n=1 Tax=Ideonella sp. TaxID=1929293 RepID=UPI002B48C0E6|nr:hydroxysqualene dehydroxylase HpnE [Ideonella sp.]HJV72362.1 hydroxysqualene dehydroxylase HpnE [Ideonella sp.]
MSPGAEAKPPQRVAVVGGGWAGLAAAVHATTLGHQASLYEMAPQLGGRARSVTHDGITLDNGQHILIGAYRDTLALMRRVGVEPDQVLHRQPLTLLYPDGSGLCLPPGPALPAFARGVWAWRELPWRQRLGLLALAAQWRWQGFRCAPALTVAELARRCPPQAYRELIEPLCVAALNTPAEQASAQVLLTVLRDALFGEPGAADLLLPKGSLDALLPRVAGEWLRQHGASVALGHRVMRLDVDASGADIDGERYDHVVLATPPGEAARLVETLAPAWSREAAAFRYQPIITAWLQASAARWPQPMMALRADNRRPAQFGFDLGALGGPRSTYALVVSGAAAWVDAGTNATRSAILNQWDEAFPARQHGPVKWLDSRTEKRATFACTPGLKRPAARVHARVTVAGDHVEGPYPATLEGAVRSGLAAVQALGRAGSGA